MIDASRASGASLMVAHCWRFRDEVIALRDRIAAGELGEVVKTRGYGVHAGWGPAGLVHAIRRSPGGGALVDMGVHAIDTARFLLGDPAAGTRLRRDRHAVRAGPLHGGRRRHPADRLVATGRTAIVESGWWQPHLGGLEADTEVYGTRRLRAHLAAGGAAARTTSTARSRCTRRRCAEFLARDRRGPCSRGPAGEDGRVVMEVVERPTPRAPRRTRRDRGPRRRRGRPQDLRHRRRRDRSACSASAWAARRTGRSPASRARARPSRRRPMQRSAPPASAAASSTPRCSAWPASTGPRTLGLLDGVIGPLGFGGPHRIVNDAFVALRAGTTQPWGVVVISGTGTVAAGRNPAGDEFRTIGEGRVFGDFGSEFDVSELAVRAVADAYTGRGPSTMLTELICDAGRGRHGIDVARAPQPAGHAAAVARGREHGAAGARGDGARGPRGPHDPRADRLARSATRPAWWRRASRCGTWSSKSCCAGNLFRTPNRYLMDQLELGVRRTAPRARPEVLNTPPVVGAGLMALELAGPTIGAGAAPRLAGAAANHFWGAGEDA